MNIRKILLWVLSILFIIGQFSFPSGGTGKAHASQALDTSEDLIAHWAMDYDSPSGGAYGYGQILNSASNAWHLNKGSSTSLSTVAQVGTKSLDLRGATATTNPYTVDLSSSDSQALGLALQGDGTPGFSTSVWIKPVSGRTQDLMMVMQLNPGFYLRLRLDNSLNVSTNDGSGALITLNGTNTTAITNDVWNHVLAVLEPAGNNKFTIKVYVNGVFYVQKTNITGYRTYDASTSKLQIGRGVTSGYFAGQVDDIRFYKRALTASEAVELASAAVYNPAYIAPPPELPIQITVKKGSDLTPYAGVTMAVNGNSYESDSLGRISTVLPYGNNPYTLTKASESASGILQINTPNQTAELYLGQLPEYAVTFQVTSSGAPLPGASVTVAGVTQNTYMNGEAVFPAIPYGTHPYTISMTGYDSVSGSVYVSAATTVSVGLNRSVDPGAVTVKVTANYGLLQENGPPRPAFNIYLDKTVNQDIQVRYAMSGSAISGTDYAPLPGIITIPAGQTSVFVQLQPLNDSVGEWMKRITLQLLADDSEVIRYLPAPGKLSAADIWLEDDETPGPGSLGTNLSPYNYYATQVTFVDAMKSSAGFIPGNNANVDYTMDENGNLLTLASGQKVTNVLYLANGGQYPPGVYTFLYDGSATFSFRRDAVKISEQPGRIQVEVNPTDSGIFLEVSNVDVSNPPRNLRFISPGFADLYETEIWQPALLEFFQPFQVIRAMDLMSANFNPTVTWDSRTTPQSLTQARTGTFTEGGKIYDKPYGVSAEYLTALANRANRDLWVNLPHMADDNYIQQFATYLRDQLNPNLKVYVEYSNEVWNTAFVQNAYAKRKGLDRGYPSTEAGHTFYANRSVEIFNIFESVFTGETERLVRVLASQNNSANASEIILGAPIPGGTKAYEHADAFAVAPYFGGGLSSDNTFLAQLKTSSTPSQDIFERLLNDDFQNLLYEQIRDNATIARKHGLKLIAYEGGQHLVAGGNYSSDNEVIEILSQANRAPGMEQVYAAYLQLWKENGGSLFTHYAGIAVNGKNGSWGALENMYQDATNVPKYKALRSFMDQNPKWWSDTVDPLPPVRSLEAKQLPSGLSLDNRLDEPAWEMTDLDRKYNNQTGSNNEAQFGVLWDADSLYIGVRVKDSILNADSANAFDDDSVEVFIDGDLSKSRGWDVHDYRLVKRYNEGIWDSQGYTLEFAIPWSTLGIEPADGLKLGLDVNAYDDDNGGARDAILGWEGTKFNYVTTAYMGELVLSDEVVRDGSLSAAVPAAVTADADWSAVISMNPRNPVDSVTFIVEYDESKTDFVSAQAVHPSAVLDTVDGSSPGQVAITVSFDSPVEEAAGIVSMVFHAKAFDNPSDSQLIVRDGSFQGADGPAAAYGGAWPFAIQMDSSDLADLLSAARLLHDEAVAGTEPGQYTLEAKLRLEAAIALAQDVCDNPLTGFYKLRVAEDMLQHETTLFEDSLITAE